MNQTSQKLLSPVFIVGSGRSGTTLLRSLLNASNQIYIPYESDFIARAYPFYQNKQDFSEQDYQRIVKLFSKTSQKNGWHMEQGYLFSYLKEHAPQTFSDINSLIYEAYLKHEGLENLQWGLKTPVLIANLDRIISVFPKAKIVHIVRDGRDVYLSYKNIHENSIDKEKFGPKNIFQAAFYWIDALRRVEDFKKNLIYELRYEDLLNEPDIELKKLFEFLDIKYDSSLPERYLQSNSNKKLLKLQNYQERTLNIKKRSGIDPNNTQKYLKKMPVFERFLFELIAAPYIKKYQYSLEFVFLTSKFLMPLRDIFYFGARQFNNLRYRLREIKTYNKTV